MSGYLYLAGALVTTAAGQVLFKYSRNPKNTPLLLGGLTFLVVAAVFALLALRTLGLGLVYLSTGLTHILVLLASKWLLHEEIPRQRWGGAGLVIAGVALYAISIS